MGAGLQVISQFHRNLLLYILEEFRRISFLSQLAVGAFSSKWATPVPGGCVCLLSRNHLLQSSNWGGHIDLYSCNHLLNGSNWSVLTGFSCKYLLNGSNWWFITNIIIIIVIISSYHHHHHHHQHFTFKYSVANTLTGRAIHVTIYLYYNNNQLNIAYSSREWGHILGLLLAHYRLSCQIRCNTYDISTISI